MVHVEPGEEGDWNVVAAPPRVDAEYLKPLSRGFLLKQDYPLEKKTIQNYIYTAGWFYGQIGYMVYSSLVPTGVGSYTLELSGYMFNNLHGKF